MQIQNILEIDFKNRTGNVDSLKTLDDIDHTNQWDFSSPTLCKYIDLKYSKRMLEFKNQEFQTLFYNKFPIFKGMEWRVGTRQAGVAICGGSIGSMLFGTQINDIDFFFYGLTPLEAQEKLKYILSYLTQTICTHLTNTDRTEKEKNRKNQDEKELKIYTEADLDIRYVRNKYALSVICEGNCGKLTFPKLQFIFRCYKSLGEILHGFDIGASAVGFDGEKVYLTELSKFCYENHVNIVDTTRRSTTYEKRLIKYFDRGFDIVLPRFDISKISDRRIKNYRIEAEYCDMPELVFGYTRVIGNQIHVEKFYKPFGEIDEEDGEYSPDNIDRYKAFHQNLLFLLEGNYTAMYHISHRIGNVFKNEPAIGTKTITMWYNNGRRSSFSRGKLNTNFYRKFITVAKLPEVLEKIATLNENDLENYLDEIFEKQKNHTLNLLKEAKNLSGNIDWITENPGSQQPLTSSINPIFEDPSKWYGECFLPSA